MCILFPSGKQGQTDPEVNGGMGALLKNPTGQITLITMGFEHASSLDMKSLASWKSSLKGKGVERVSRFTVQTLFSICAPSAGSFARWKRASFTCCSVLPRRLWDAAKLSGTWTAPKDPEPGMLHLMPDGPWPFPHPPTPPRRDQSAVSAPGQAVSIAECGT